MTVEEKCTLCAGTTVYFCHFRENGYYRCGSCRSVLMAENDHLSPEEEKVRYDWHNNDVNDPRYRTFVSPLVDLVKGDYPPGASGLDYGAGPGPVAALMLRESGYPVELYDPFYWTDLEVLTAKYDFIICSEVIEHFRQPFEQFKLLRSLLKPGGALYCMTKLIEDDTDFCSWTYAHDPTHIFFYHHRAFEWIKVNFRFQALSIQDRLIRLNL